MIHDEDIADADYLECALRNPDDSWDEGTLISAIIAFSKGAERNGRTVDWPSWKFGFDDKANPVIRVQLYPV